jgi:hypothetical protein
MVLIAFESDSSFQGQGFQLKYKVDSKYLLCTLHNLLKLWKYNDLYYIYVYIYIYINFTG